MPPPEDEVRWVSAPPATVVAVSDAAWSAEAAAQTPVGTAAAARRARVGPDCLGDPGLVRVIDRMLEELDEPADIRWPGLGIGPGGRL